MSSDCKVPEVSLITSWSVIGSPLPGPNTAPRAMQEALREGVGLLDLYFLDHNDIPWYAKVANVKEEKEPTKFAAQLTVPHLNAIRNALNEGLTFDYQGKLVGRRPRFVALATYFPCISLPQEEDPDSLRRQQAVSALRNTLYLASNLGCRWVEIVGGTGVPGHRFAGTDDGEDSYRLLRRKTLVRSLCEVYDLKDDNNPLFKIQDISRIPGVAVELEPGPCLLLNGPEEFVLLRESVQTKIVRSGVSVADFVYLNIDIAHAFLMGYHLDELRDERIWPYIAHMHISDHAGHAMHGGAHASDLSPGEFHRYEYYEPWLQFAIELTNRTPVSGQRSFSGAISVEMEACNDPDRMHAAVNISRRWLQKAKTTLMTSGWKPEYRGPDLKRGVLLAVDIGNSTRELIEGKGADSLSGEPDSLQENYFHKYDKLESLIKELCKAVNNEAGSVMSFTGDGLIALFEDAHFSDETLAVAAAVSAAKAICDQVLALTDAELTVRAALHFGEAYIPSSGQLRDQIIGRDVVIAARVCDWLGKEVERGIPRSRRGQTLAITDSVWEKLAPGEQNDWEDFEKQELKGIQYSPTVYVHRTRRGRTNDASQP